MKKAPQYEADLNRGKMLEARFARRFGLKGPKQIEAALAEVAIRRRVGRRERAAFKVPVEGSVETIVGGPEKGSGGVTVS